MARSVSAQVDEQADAREAMPAWVDDLSTYYCSTEEMARGWDKGKYTYKDPDNPTDEEEPFLPGFCSM